MKRLFAFFFVAAFSGQLLAQSNQAIFLESLPERFQARLEVKTRAAARAAATGHANVAPRYFIFFTKRWRIVGQLSTRSWLAWRESGSSHFFLDANADQGGKVEGFDRQGKATAKKWLL